MATPDKWAGILLQAEFRGVPFGVLGNEGTFGRRNAVHEYPERETAWIEDQGKRTRKFEVTGFLVSDSLVYGGGDVLEQRKALVRAVETPGPGTLSHPTLGYLDVSADTCVFAERWDGQRYFEFKLSVLEDGGRLFPANKADTAQAVTAAADTASTKAADTYAKTADKSLSKGASALRKALATAVAWTDKVKAVAQDPSKLLGLASQLPGSFGRFFNGRNLGFLKDAGRLVSNVSTIQQLIGSGTTARLLLQDASRAISTALAGFGVSTTALDVANAVRGFVGQFRSSANDPADGIRLLASLHGFTPLTPAASVPGGAELDQLFRQTVAVALAETAATYQPASMQDAADLRDLVTAILDAEILAAGDAGLDDIFAAFRALRVAVVQDLKERGASLAPIVTVNSNGPVPALVLAQRLYRDSARADELVYQAAPVHPLFMPPSFEALAA